MMTRNLYQYTLQSPDIDELYRVGADFEARMRSIPGLVDVTSDLELKNPQVTVSIYRDLASSLNVNSDAIEETLFNAYASRQVSTIYTSTDAYYVILEVLPQYQQDPDALGLLYVKSSTGKLVPLGQVAGLQMGIGPLSVAHYGQLPAVTVSFNLQPGVSLGQAVDTIQRAARDNLPATISTTFQGTAAAFFFQRGRGRNHVLRGERCAPSALTFQRSSQRAPGCGRLPCFWLFREFGVCHRSRLYVPFVSKLTLLTGGAYAGPHDQGQSFARDYQDWSAGDPVPPHGR
jgi:AcrB/AcrD/AcrF family